MNSERKEQLDEIVRLCTEIEGAVEHSNWDGVGELLSRRHKLLEEVFAEPAATPGEVQALTVLAKKVMALDNTLKPLADSARGQAAEELKKLRRGRVAADIYEQNAN